MTKKLIIAAALCLLVGVVLAVPSSPGPAVPCRYPGCRKQKIIDKDLVVLIYLDGKMQHVHGYHTIQKHLPRYTK